MQNHTKAQLDPVTELFDVANAMEFLEDAFSAHPQDNAHLCAEGAAYVTGLMRSRIRDIAAALWEMEDKAAGLSPASVGFPGDLPTQIQRHAPAK